MPAEKPNPFAVMVRSTGVLIGATTPHKDEWHNTMQGDEKVNIVVVA